MPENWKLEFTALLLGELSKRTSKAIKIESAKFSEEIESKRDALNKSKFLLFVESEQKKIKQSQSWEWFYMLISEYRAIQNLEKILIGEHTASLSEPPNDISNLVALVEQNQNHKIFLEGLKLRQKIEKLRNTTSKKTWRKHDPFAECLAHAIEHEKFHLGNTPAKVEFAQSIAGMLEAQVNWQFSDYVQKIRVRFERLNRKSEQLAFLEGERSTLQNSLALAYFDKRTNHFDSAFDNRHKVEMAVRLEVKPTLEILETWQKSNPKPEGLIQSIPFLSQMIEGWIEAKKFELIELELGLLKASMGKSDILVLQPVKVKKTEEKVLPELEGVLRYPERIPSLWKFLITQQEKGKGEAEIFNEVGYIGSNDRNAAPLMGLAEGLRLMMQLKPGFNERDVYQILCKRFNVEPTGEPHKAKKRAKFRDVRDWVRGFFEKT
jgi:hypothetical protein